MSVSWGALTNAYTETQMDLVDYEHQLEQTERRGGTDRPLRGALLIARALLAVAAEIASFRKLYAQASGEEHKLQRRQGTTEPSSLRPE